MRGESGVAGEGKLVDEPKFYSQGDYTMTLTNIYLHETSNTSSALCINLHYVIFVI